MNRWWALYGVLIGWTLREHAPELFERLVPCQMCAERRRLDMPRHPSARPRVVPEQPVRT